MSRAEKLRAAATRLREAPHGLAAQRDDVVTVGGEHIGGCPDCRVAPEMDHSNLIVGLLNSRERLADLLDTAADLLDAQPTLDGQHPDGTPCDDLACRVVTAALAIADLIGGEA